MNWNCLIDESALTPLLPTEYAYFAKPICAGLSIFLEGLPEPEQMAILAAQATLPAAAPLAVRLGLLARSCPVLQKLGQILARDQRLAAELRDQLRQLESLPATVPVEVIQEELVRELGPLHRRGVTLRPPALAEASVAVVIPFHEEAVGGGGPREGVFKLLKPGIEERLELELGLLERVGAHLDQRCDELRIPHLDYQESFCQVRDKLQGEVRLDAEQRHMTEARACYARDSQVQIPALFDHCTPRVTAMERIHGHKVTDHRGLDARGKGQLARLLARAIIARPVLARQSHSLFHCDPHAGNLFLTHEGRLAILDWSLVGRLGEEERVAIMQIMLGTLTWNVPRIVAVLAALSERGTADRARLELVVRARLRRIRQGQLPGLTWLVGLLDEAVQDAGLRVHADLMLFRKSLYTLVGVASEVGAQGCPIDQVVAVEFLRQLAWEWPRRWVSSPVSRQFGTRLSNLDLTQTMLSYPSTVARLLIDQSRDCRTACRVNAHEPT